MAAGITTLSERSQVRTRELAYLGLLVATLGWGGAFIAGKLALRDFSALSTSAWRFAAASALLLPFAIRQFRAASFAPVAGPLALMVVCGGVLYPWLFMASLERTSATNTSLIISVMPVLTYALCPLVGESISRRRWVAMVLAMVGAVVVITRGDPARILALGSLNLGDLLALGAAAVWSVFNLASRRTVAGLPTPIINTFIYGIGGAVLFALALPDRPVAQLTAASPVGLGGLLFLAIVPSVLSGHIYLHAMRVLGVSRTVPFVYCVPFVTATMAALLLGEELNYYQAAGGAFIFSGLLLALDRRGAPG
jgi:drug/metabolite transporter (DMT)-like permease